jgi:hypothetical protein
MDKKPRNNTVLAFMQYITVVLEFLYLIRVPDIYLSEPGHRDLVNAFGEMSHGMRESKVRFPLIEDNAEELSVADICYLRRTNPFFRGPGAVDSRETPVVPIIGNLVGTLTAWL